MTRGVRHNSPIVAMSAEIVAAGLGSPEGPLWVGNDNWLVVEMADDRGCITRVRADGSFQQVCSTGRPNGLVRTEAGTILAAESALRSIIALEPGWETASAHWTTVADADIHGRSMLFPNDLAVGPDGSVWVTDSGLELETMKRELLTVADPTTLPFDGRVYRMDPNTWEVDTFDAGLGHLNGISFGPNGDLYVNDTISGDVFRYPWESDGPGERTLFANVIDPTLPPAFRGPDGMAHDIAGNLYVTVWGQGEVIVLSPAGEWIQRLPTAGARPTNVAFHPARAEVVVTEVETGTLQQLPALAPGLPLPGWSGL